MNKLIKGNLVMTNIADKDIDMYVKAGWKLDKTETENTSNKKTLNKSKNKELLKKLSDFDETNEIEEIKVEDVKDTTTSDTNEE